MLAIISTPRTMLRKRLNPESFRTIVLGVLMIASIGLIASAVGGIG